MVDAGRADDYTRIGRITDPHALRMHAFIASTDPPIRYLAPASIAVFDAVAALRAESVEAYATADAGPNVAVLTRPGDSAAVARRLAEFGRVHDVGAGPGAELVAADRSAP